MNKYNQIARVFTNDLDNQVITIVSANFGISTKGLTMNKFIQDGIWNVLLWFAVAYVLIVVIRAIVHSI